jgi:hypothetical protein
MQRYSRFNKTSAGKWTGSVSQILERLQVLAFGGFDLFRKNFTFKLPLDVERLRCGTVKRRTSTLFGLLGRRFFIRK